MCLHFGHVCVEIALSFQLIFLLLVVIISSLT